MNDSYANVYINKMKKKEKYIAINNKRSKYNYSITEANNNPTKEREKHKEFDYEQYQTHTETHHNIGLNSKSKPKELKQPFYWKELISLYEEIINKLLNHLIELTEESNFNSIKSNIITHIKDSQIKRMSTESIDHLLFIINKAKYKQISTRNELKLFSDQNQPDTLYSLFKRNKANSNQGITKIQSNAFNSPYLTSVTTSKPMIEFNQYNSPQLRSNNINGINNHKNVAMKIKSNHSAFNYFSSLLKRDVKPRVNHTTNTNHTNAQTNGINNKQMFKNNRIIQYNSINFANNLRKEINLSPIKTTPLSIMNPNAKTDQEGTESSKSKEGNVELLSQIKSSLDDNLKVMFNFSYESFLNKESERESKYSNED